MAIIGRDHKQAEARRHLELPAYHRGLRKQIYPPRVRYTSQSNSSSLFSEASTEDLSRALFGSG
ncbi:hypothetical protein [Sporisorium scitamineum]|uniref:Uncharacterized protein n=1 Tax=Sporisorium scitamineum TaxID=49012 RepID=A0A0F7SA69_9BASI|nr:hypothetical protein [Sporisorium scitamineum]